MLSYPRIPELDPRAPGEDPQAYGLRALCFILTTDQTAGVDDEGLRLADYVHPVAVGARDLSPTAAERLADVQRRIGAALRVRQAVDAQVAQDAALAEPQAPAAGRDTPRQGPGAPLRPAPVTPTAPAAQAPVADLTPAGAVWQHNPARAARLADALTVPAPALRPIIRPAAPQVSAEEWGF